jgi:hypothetical protein
MWTIICTLTDCPAEGQEQEAFGDLHLCVGCGAMYEKSAS